MSTIRRKMILTGGRKGHTCKLGYVQFEDGVANLVGSVRDVEALTVWLEVNYQAYPEGDSRLEADNGQCDLPETSEDDRQHGDESGVQQSGEGSPETPAPDSPESAPADEGAADGRIPEGNGHPNAGLAEALSQLDVMEDAHWTAAGLPACAAVEQLVGRPVTRSEIDSVAPDLKREG